MNISIRQAVPDDARYVAPLIYDAIGEIANRLTGQSEYTQIINELEELFTRTDNRHTYLNTYVAVHVESTNIVGILVVYSGLDGRKLDQSLEKHLKRKNAPVTTIEIEAHDDEFYVDTICVHHSVRGQGVGTKLLHFAEQVAKSKGYSKISLNVETQKEQARHLYEKVGYVITEPWTIINEPFYHMVKNI